MKWGRSQINLAMSPFGFTCPGLNYLKLIPNYIWMSNIYKKLIHFRELFIATSYDINYT